MAWPHRPWQPWQSSRPWLPITRSLLIFAPKLTRRTLAAAEAEKAQVDVEPVVEELSAEDVPAVEVVDEAPAVVEEAAPLVHEPPAVEEIPVVAEAPVEPEPLPVVHAPVAKAPVVQAPQIQAPVVVPPVVHAPPVAVSAAHEPPAQVAEVNSHAKCSDESRHRSRIVARRYVLARGGRKA